MTNLQVVTTDSAEMENRDMQQTVQDLRLTAFVKSMRDIKEFIADNDRLMDIFFDLIDDYNTTLEDIKGTIREIPGDDKVKIGPFTRGKRPVNVKFDPALLDTSVLRVPGVVKIDRKAVEAALAEGKLAFSDIENARSEVKGTARITGPKEIQFNL